MQPHRHHKGTFQTGSILLERRGVADTEENEKLQNAYPNKNFIR